MIGLPPPRRSRTTQQSAGSSERPTIEIRLRARKAPCIAAVPQACSVCQEHRPRRRGPRSVLRHPVRQRQQTDTGRVPIKKLRFSAEALSFLGLLGGSGINGFFHWFINWLASLWRLGSSHLNSITLFFWQARQRRAFGARLFRVSVS